jgi:uncharacterized membrane protein
MDSVVPSNAFPCVGTTTEMFDAVLIKSSSARMRGIYKEEIIRINKIIFAILGIVIGYSKTVVSGLY